ncbi:hypothetical protein BUE80_DR004803 [Diplocarpon rosae]|nr:hypothetical protein BUE80_DR004803 [Diplocarpon rosae]
MQLAFALPPPQRLVVALLGLSAIVSATPVPCPDRKIDMILGGQLDPAACCSYGICKGDVNVQGG